MKKLLLLTLLGIGAFASQSRAQVLTAGRFVGRINIPSALPVPPAGFAGFQLRRDSAGVYTWYVRDNTGTFKVGGGGAFTLPSDVVRQTNNATLNNVYVTSALWYRNPNGLPPEADASDDVFIQGFKRFVPGNPSLDGGGQRIRRSSIAWRAVGAAPLTKNDPGVPGDTFVDEAAGQCYDYKPKAGGGGVWVRYACPGFSLPSGPLPSAPVLTASYSQALQNVSLTWTQVGAVSGFELFRQVGGGDWIQINVYGPNAPPSPAPTDNAPWGPGTVVNYRLRAFNANGASGFSNVASITTQGTVTTAGRTRQLIWNAILRPGRAVVDEVKNYVTGVKFDILWADLQSAPGTFVPAYRDSLLAGLARCKALGKKAEILVFPHLLNYKDGTPQHYTQFGVGLDDLTRYRDGNLYKWLDLPNRDYVQPSFSSAQGMAAVRRMYREVAQLVQSYITDGTLINFCIASGKEGEMTYPFDPSGTKVTDFSPVALSDFRAWLAAKYNSPPAMNAAWGTSYGNFAAVGWEILPADLQFGITSEKLRDWQRWRIQRLRDFYVNARAGVREVAPNLPCLAMSSSLGGGFQHVVAFAGTNVAAFAAVGMDGMYNTDGGGYTVTEAKLSQPDVLFGTLGGASTNSIEFDTDDLDTQSRNGSAATFDQASVLYSVGKKAFERGVWVIHLTQIGGTWNWGLVAPHAAQLISEYCTAPNNAVASRSPEATTTYTYTAQLTTDGTAEKTAWRAAGGSATKIVDVRQIDDFGIGGGGVVPPVPQAPAVPGLEAATWASPNVALSWTHDGSGTAFEVFRKTGTGGVWAQVAQLGGAARTWTDFGPHTAGTTQVYRIRATNSAGASGFSVERSAVIPSPSVIPVLSYRYTSGQAWLDWSYSGSQAPPPSSAIIQRSTNGGGFGDWGGADFTNGSIPISLPINAIHAYRLRVTKEGVTPNSSEWSNTVCVDSQGLIVCGSGGGSQGAPLTTLTRAQPNSTQLTAVAELSGADNWTASYQLDRFPNFSAPNGYQTQVFCDATTAELLKFLDKGTTAVDAAGFVEEWDETGQTIGRNVPYTRRARIMYENALGGNGGVKWRRGDNPATYNSFDQSDVRGSTLSFFADSRAFADVTASHHMWVNWETCAYCGPAWEQFIRDFAVNPLASRFGQGGNFGGASRVQVTGRPYNAAWANASGWLEALGYYKTSFAIEEPGGDGFAGYERFPDFWKLWQDRQGAWVRLALGNTEWARSQYPNLKIFSKWAPYDEVGQGQTDRDGLWNYYVLRPDVAENAPIVNAFAGGRGISLWNIGMRPGEPKAAIERHLRGIWRLAQLSDILDGSHTTGVVQISLDGGATWITPQNGAGWGGFEANVTNGFVPYITGGNQPTLNVPPVAARIQARYVKKGNQVAVMVIDPWNWEGTTRDVLVRYEGVTDSVRLYGWNLYLGRDTLGVEIWIVVLLLPNLFARNRRGGLAFGQPAAEVKHFPVELFNHPDVKWFLPLLLVLPGLAWGQAPGGKALEYPVAEWQDVAGKSLTIRYNLYTVDSLGASAAIRDEAGRLRLTVPVATSQHDTGNRTPPNDPPNQILYLNLTASANTLPPGRYVLRTLLTANAGAEGRRVIVQKLTLFANPTQP